MLIKAVIFDFDGLIVDTESVWFDAYQDVLNGYGVKLRLEEFAKVIGTNNGGLYRYVVSESKGKALQKEIIEAAARARYSALMATPKLREGVLDYLEAAKKAGLKIGLASSSSGEWVEGYLKQFHIDSYFETIQTKDHVKRTKPDPEVYIRALEALDVQAEEAFAFEDSLNGLKAARAAGLKCVIVPNPATAQLPFADFTHRLTSMKDITFDKLLTLVSSIK